MAKLLDDALANTVQDVHRERQHTRVDRTRRRVGPENVGGGKVGWWGEITACATISGTGKAKQAEGDYPNLTIVSGAEEVDVILGAYPPYRIGMTAHFLPSGPGVEPVWTINQAVKVRYQEPDAADLADDQDDGGGVRATCDD